MDRLVMWLGKRAYHKGKNMAQYPWFIRHGSWWQVMWTIGWERAFIKDQT